MKRVKKNVLITGMMLLCIAVCLFSCTTVDGQAYVPGTTTAGPYITDIVFDDEGNLLVTRSTVVLCPGMYQMIHSENPKTTVIKVPERKMLRSD